MDVVLVKDAGVVGRVGRRLFRCGKIYADDGSVAKSVEVNGAYMIGKPSIFLVGGCC